MLLSFALSGFRWNAGASTAGEVPAGKLPSTHAVRAADGLPVKVGDGRVASWRHVEEHAVMHVALQFGPMQSWLQGARVTSGRSFHRG